MRSVVELARASVPGGSVKSVRNELRPVWMKNLHHQKGPVVDFIRKIGQVCQFTESPEI